MGNRASGPRVTAQDHAVLEMKMQRDKLQQYQNRIQCVLDREKEIARQSLAAGNKSRALLALRKRKHQQQLLTKTDQQLQVLQELTSSVEFALVQRDVLFGLQQGNQVLSALNKEMSLDMVERIMEESAEARAYQQELSDTLVSSITNSDEADVQLELEELERQELAAKLPDIPQNMTGAAAQRTRDSRQDTQDPEPVLES